MGKIFNFLGNQLKKSRAESKDPDLMYRLDQEAEDRRRQEDDQRREAEIQERERREIEYSRDDYHW